jgi:uncharacterized protein YecE (DUF72 family)
MQNVWLGCSGWSYKEWIGAFYREGEKSMLKAYTQVFKTVEIDSTFYRYPNKGMVYGWLRYSPQDFTFAAKLPQLITHEKKLDTVKGVEQDLNKFLELMEPLQFNGKLACLLAQLPPSLKFNLNLLESFLALFPTQFRLAVEFRHLSWMNPQMLQLLEKYQVAYTAVDEPLLPPDMHVTTDFAYIRWHGKGEAPWYNYQYKTEELEPWVPKVKAAAQKAKKVYGYFNNHYHAYAVKNSLEMAEMLEIITKEQKTVKDKVGAFLEAKMKAPPPKPSMELTAFMPEKIASMKLDDLLKVFMDDSRIKRAREIKDSEVSIEQASEDVVKAKVREYHVSIDVPQRLILHDCADWSRSAPAKQLCKHVGKVMLSLPDDISVSILKKIGADRENWEFKPYVA